MNTTFNISLELLTSATFAWCAYYFASFAGFENLSIIAGMPALILSAVGFGGLAIAAVIWVVKHVRITIV